jgi:beta-N-acetylhexosaminidase
VIRSQPSRTARLAAARLCVVDFPGPEPSARLERLIADSHLGGVVLFRKNVVQPSQVAALTAQVRDIAAAARVRPPAIAIDHEGGVVNRFPPHDDRPRVTAFPGAMAIGATGDARLAYRAGAASGHELRALGIHHDYAPVADVNNNPDNPVIGVRAFGERPELVETMALAFARGLQDAGVAATVKHFPGHGDTDVDSHDALPLVGHDRDRLDRIELRPFEAAVRDGVASVMTAHIVYPALDATRAPATMSAPIVQGILRDRWGFDGLVCTDSLLMRAIADHYGMGEAAVASVRAGCDVVLALGAEEAQDEVLGRLAVAIETGEISSARLAEALARVDAFAARWVGPDRQAYGGADVTDEADTAARLATEIAEAAVTVVRDRFSLLPLRGRRVGVVVVTPDVADVTDPGETGAAPFTVALRRRLANVEDLTESFSRTVDRRSTSRVGPVDLSRLDGVIAVTHSRGRPSPALPAALAEVHRAAGDRMILVATGTPYDLLACRDVGAFVATYGRDPAMLDAAAKVLAGKVAATGRLPVSIPGLHDVGHRYRAT